MPPKKLLPALLLFAIFATIACHKELSQEKGPDIDTPIPQIVKSDIQGRVLDEHQRPVHGAQVSCGIITGTTDINGVFLLKNTLANADAAVVKVVKTGYFNAIRTLVTTENAMQYIQVGLLPKKIIASFTNDGKTVTLPQGELSFMPQQILKADNTPYAGTVDLVYAYINPESDDFSDIMPGDLRGITLQNRQTGLESFGMIAVELLGSQGELLHLDATKQVTMKMSIPASLQSKAPAVMPLWYFDETTGFWKEEGSAAKQGNFYVGTIKHFSYWNLDVPFPLANFSATIVDQQGTPLSNLKVALTRKSNGNSLYAYTNNKGEIAGKVPANEPLEMSLINHCNAVIHEQGIGPFEKTGALGTVKVTILPVNAIAIEGTVDNCDGAPVNDGLVNVSIDGLHYSTTIQNGTYKITVIRCNTNPTTANFMVFDAATNESRASTAEVGTGKVTIPLTACGDDITNLFTFNIDGRPYTFLAPSDSFSIDQTPFAGGNTFNIQCMRRDYSESLSLSFSAKDDGTTATLAPFSYFASGQYFVHDSMTVNITSPGTPGGFISGKIGGRVKDSASAVLSPITGNFRIKKK